VEGFRNLLVCSLVGSEWGWGLVEGSKVPIFGKSLGEDLDEVYVGTVGCTKAKPIFW
jgi:hypothetical protein